MLTEIESFLFSGHNRAYNVVEVGWIEGALFIAISPYGCPSEVKKAVFMHAELQYEELLVSPGEALEFPVPLVGFDCYETGNPDRWKFVLNAAEVEYGFVAKWPHWD